LWRKMVELEKIEVTVGSIKHLIGSNRHLYKVHL
jgi:desulfoferrodoxin (superoxide reductase-like protein)